MPAVIFLDEASAHQTVCSEDAAREWALLLVSTLRAARKVNRRLALNTESSLKNCMVAPGMFLGVLLAGTEFREEWDFMRDLADRSPLDAALEEFSPHIAGSEVFTASDVSSRALLWAHLMCTATASFACHADWQQPSVRVRGLEVAADGELQEFLAEIRNLSCPDHPSVHQPWLESLGFSAYPDPRTLWNEREERFAALRFLPRVEADMQTLAAAGAPYAQALNALADLNADARNWPAGAAWPQFKGKVSPESATRRLLCDATDNVTGQTESFEWHSRFTGGLAGRVHFRVAPAERKIVIGYVGKKLDAPIP